MVSGLGAADTSNGFTDVGGAQDVGQHVMVDEAKEMDALGHTELLCKGP